MHWDVKYLLPTVFSVSISLVVEVVDRLFIYTMIWSVIGLITNVFLLLRLEIIYPPVAIRVRRVV